MKHVLMVMVILPFLFFSCSSEKTKEKIKFLKNEISDCKKDLLNMTNKLDKVKTLKDSLEIELYNQLSQTNSNWININIGEYKSNFRLTYEGDLYYNDEYIKGSIVRKEKNSIQISPFSIDKRYVMCATFDSDRDYSGLFLLDLNSFYSYPIDIYYPYMWLSWSPNKEYAILAHYYEADMTLYSYDLKNKILNKLDFSKDLKKSGNIFIEEIKLEVENLKWISKNSFKIPANIYCNPYTNNDCDNKNRKSTLRSLIYTYDLLQNKITYTEKITK